MDYFYVNQLIIFVLLCFMNTLKICTQTYICIEKIVFFLNLGCIIFNNVYLQL